MSGKVAQGYPGPLSCLPSLYTYLSAPLLDGVDGQWALDAPIAPQEHLPLVCLIELWLGLGFGGVHAQADHLGRGDSSSGGRCTGQLPAPILPYLLLVHWLLGGGLVRLGRGCFQHLLQSPISLTPLHTHPPPPAQHCSEQMWAITCSVTT